MSESNNPKDSIQDLIKAKRQVEELPTGVSDTLASVRRDAIERINIELLTQLVEVVDVVKREVGEIAFTKYMTSLGYSALSTELEFSESITEDTSDSSDSTQDSSETYAEQTKVSGIINMLEDSIIINGYELPLYRGKLAGDAAQRYSDANRRMVELVASNPDGRELKSAELHKVLFGDDDQRGVSSEQRRTDLGFVRRWTKYLEIDGQKLVHQEGSTKSSKYVIAPNNIELVYPSLDANAGITDSAKKK